MYTVLLPPGDNPIAVNKYIISCHRCDTRKGGTIHCRFFYTGVL